MAYKTKNRSLLVSLFENSAGRALSPTMIQEKLTQTGASIGIATIYRQLDSLVRDGVLQKDPGLGGPHCALYSLNSHEVSNEDCFFLKCTSCGRFEKVGCEHLQEFRSHLLAHHSFLLQPGQTYLYGLCRFCAERGK
ncbi:MAG: transcriptional repressor [Succinivibrio sp.]|nr:transcriptional repressor [Succinivibrio sp.]